MHPFLWKALENSSANAYAWWGAGSGNANLFKAQHSLGNLQYTLLYLISAHTYCQLAAKKKRSTAMILLHCFLSSFHSFCFSSVFFCIIVFICIALCLSMSHRTHTMSNTASRTLYARIFNITNHVYAILRCWNQLIQFNFYLLVLWPWRLTFIHVTASVLLLKCSWKHLLKISTSKTSIHYLLGYFRCMMVTVFDSISGALWIY